MPTMTKAIATALDLTTVAAQAGVKLNVSPFLGGQNHNALVISDIKIGGSGVLKIQGNPGVVGGGVPPANDTGWADILSLTSASPLENEIKLPLWIRTNVTTAGTGTATITLEGVQ